MQKLSYRDRIIILVVLVIFILIAGFMLLIKPKHEKLKSAEASLKTAQAQWDELEMKISKIDTIKERVQKKYDESVELGNFFVDIKRAYTLERFIQEYIDKNGIYINTNASFTDPSVVPLEAYELYSTDLEYSIGDSANLIGDENKTSDTSNSSKETGTQSLPCGTITIDYYATRTGLLQFMQDIKESNKTIEIKSITIGNGSYSTENEAILKGEMTIDVYYAEMISDIDIGAEISEANENVEKSS